MAPVRSGWATSYTLLHTFSLKADGGTPGPLVLDKAGHLWGTASKGGTQNGGVFFEMKPPPAGQMAWHFRSAFKFKTSTGATPLGPFAERQGDFYGSASAGGPRRGGAVYRLTQAGALTDLQSFAKHSPPPCAIAMDKTGNLYGEANIYYYGENTNASIFKITPADSFTVLYTFAEKYKVQPGLLVEKSGALVGTAFNSKSGRGDGGFIFRLSPDGTFRTLYQFTGGTDGDFPNAPLVADSAGNLYGTTQHGAINNSGTVFKLAADGSLTTLYSFQGNGSDGAYPESGVVLDAAGNLYGTTQMGGATNNGTVFEIGTDGTETILHFFAGGTDGAAPQSPLVIGPQGQLFGATAFGGAEDVGVVYEITP
jgi:uncharacterized repeat protein (TIGR03803 family)